MIQKLFPNGKEKAFSLSYDDGVEQDVRLVALLNRYGLKGTFNLNSGLMLNGFSWTHESGLVVKRLSPEMAKVLYAGHEVACHTFSHPYLDDLPEGEVLKELAADKYLLERLFGREIAGYATPFTYYSEKVARCVRKCGFAYARISQETGDYRIPEDVYYWRGGKFHWDADLSGYVDAFLQTDQELAICQIVGHSYDLDVMGTWEQMEEIFCKVSRCPNVAAMTNLEIVRYVLAINQACITDDYIQNCSELEIWLRVDGEVISLDSGEMYFRKD